jgi:hypothetical protein
MAHLDIDSTQRRVYGHAKVGAGFGAAKVGGYTVRLRGLNPLLAAVSTPTCAPVLVGTRLRGGTANSARGAESWRGDCGEITHRREELAYGLLRGGQPWYLVVQTGNCALDSAAAARRGRHVPTPRGGPARAAAHPTRCRWSCHLRPRGSAPRTDPRAPRSAARPAPSTAETARVRRQPGPVSPDPSAGCRDVAGGVGVLVRLDERPGLGGVAAHPALG